MFVCIYLVIHDWVQWRHNSVNSVCQSVCLLDKCIGLKSHGVKTNCLVCFISRGKRGVF